MNNNYPFALHMTNLKNVSIFNNGTLHYNITLPTELDENRKIKNMEQFIKDNSRAIKLIQYMAMGKPTISTPLEANIKINRDSNNLFSSNEDEWLSCIELFIRDFSFYRNVGVENRKIVEKYYSIENNYLKYVEIFNQIK